ncbi:MAG: hypothetical protein GWO20_12720 [Candidatus Korarchaeota archaeon]|nr:hypothetical protein [Candidatus Korarchaeota archaeon]
MGKTFRRVNKSERPKAPTKKRSKYRSVDQYKGISSNDLDDYEDYED